MSEFRQFTELRTVSVADLLQHPTAPQGFILEPWLRERHAAMLFAPTGAGKSQVAMSMALAVASGGEVLQWKASTPRSVLYCDGEMDRTDLVERFTSLAHAVAPPVSSEGFSRLHLLARDLHDPTVEFPDLGTDDGHATLLRHAEQVGASLVILDNLSTLATVDDENSASAIKPVIELIQKLRQAGCATLLVHHSDKSGKNYRGSSNLATTFAWVLGLAPTKEVACGAMDVTLEWHKTRNGANAATVPKRLRLVGTGAACRWEVGESDAHQTRALEQAIRSCGYVSLEEAGAAIGIKRARAYVVQKAMFAAGLMDSREVKRCFEDARKIRDDQAVETGEASQDF